jgi:phenylacetate-CoA ligase
MIYQKILSDIIFPIRQIRRPKSERIFAVLGFLEKTQWWKRSELEAFQQERLQALLKHAYENTSYYHRIFKELKLKPEDIKNVGDLQKLPILTKEHIRNNLDDLTAKNYSKEELIPSATGGSTGEPMRFFIDKEGITWNMAAAYREWNWAGYNLGDKIAYLWGAPQDLSHQAELKARIYNLIQRTIWLDAFDMTEKIFEEYVRILRKFKPKVINAYASAIYLMAQYMEKRGIDDIRPKAILTSCEMLFDYQRETIERAFGCEVFDYYSGRDTTLQAGECPEHSGYHLSIETGMVEFVKDGEHVAPGELGEIVITDLCNYAMPFIRYEIGDLGVPSDEVCSCGLGLPLMEKVVGRSNDILFTSDNKIIVSTFIPYLFYPDCIYSEATIKQYQKIKQFQVIQKNKNEIIVKIIKEPESDERGFYYVLTNFKKCFGENVNIKLMFVESIPPLPSGKINYIISNVNKIRGDTNGQ